MATLSSHTSNTTILSILLLFIVCKGVSSTTFTFVNKCDFLVWPGILSSAGSPKLDSTGFELPKGASRSFQAPSGWSGRFWGRTGCNFDGLGKGSCSTGDCGSGEIQCNGAGANPPATLAEFTLGSGSSRDFYDVSLVDGYNLPMFVEGRGESGECETTGCYVDLNLRCPTELKTEGGGGCKSACDAFGSPEYCCSGAYNTAATCKPSMYSQIFKSACPKSYSYAYDDATSTFTCMGADYTVTFCPSPSVTSRQTAPKTTGTEGSGSENGSDSGSVEAAMLANGSWLANLATADSTRPQPSLVHQFAFIVLALVSLIFSFSHL